MRYWCYAGGKRSVKSAWNGFRYMQTSIWRTNRRAEEADWQGNHSVYTQGGLNIGYRKEINGEVTRRV